MDAFLIALSRNWDLIVTVSMWAVSLLLGLVLGAKILKALQMKFEFEDLLPLVFSALWFGVLLVFGPADVTTFLQDLL